MSLASNYNSTFTITRQTRDSVEDGTPIYVDSVVTVVGWFDELETRPLDEPFRGQSIPYTDRRALFMCDAGADLQQDDTGTILIGALDRGWWQVSVVRTAPTPSGAGHLEVQLQGVKESK
jgi:hypothetical protein